MGGTGGYVCGRDGLCDDDGVGVMVIGTNMVIFRTFINKVFNFFGIGISLYIIANVYTWVSNDAVIKNTVKCKFCRKRISEKVCFVSLIIWSRGAQWRVADYECW